MPMPRNRSNSVRKIKHRLPSGKTAIRYRRREKGGKHSCATCGGRMQGTHSMSYLKPSLRSPNRKFGGMLCPSCAKRVIILQSRLDGGALSIDEVEVKLLPYMKKK